MKAYLAVFALLVTCSASGGPRTLKNPFVPGTSYLYMLEGPIDKLALSYDVYNLDLDTVEAHPTAVKRLKKAGKQIICYFSAGSWENTRSPNRYLGINNSSLGKRMPGWDEHWLDIRDPSVRVAQVKIMEAALAAGCDAVEPDNLDHYANDTGFNITQAETISYLRWLADTAHALKGRGGARLRIGLKNTQDSILAGSLHKKFDFIINEQCFTYSECQKLRPFVAKGKAVYIIEYEKTHESDPYPIKNFARDCRFAKNENFFFYVYRDQSVNGDIVAYCR